MNKKNKVGRLALAGYLLLALAAAAGAQLTSSPNFAMPQGSESYGVALAGEPVGIEILGHAP